MGRKQRRRNRFRLWLIGVICLAIFWLSWAVYLLPNLITKLSTSFAVMPLVAFIVGSIIVMITTGLIVNVGLRNNYFHRRS